MNDTKKPLVFRLFDDDVVRQVFDHVRNLLICAAVAGLSRFLNTTQGKESVASDELFAAFLSNLLLVAAAFLFTLNQRNAYQKLLAGRGPWMSGLIVLIYNLFAASILVVAIRR